MKCCDGPASVWLLLESRQLMSPERVQKGSNKPSGGIWLEVTADEKSKKHESKIKILGGGQQEKDKRKP